MTDAKGTTIVAVQKSSGYEHTADAHMVSSITIGLQCRSYALLGRSSSLLFSQPKSPSSIEIIVVLHVPRRPGRRRPSARNDRSTGEGTADA